MMYRASNTVIGWLNLVAMVASLPIIGGGLWFARSSSTCETFLEGPVLGLGFMVLLVSLAGFGGACFGIAWVLWVYLVAMVLLIAALLGITVFGFAVTGGGGGVEVEGRNYREYRLEDYSGWLRHHVEAEAYWKAASACVVGSKACAEISMWTPLDYLHRDLTPIQSGCCKPPTTCKYEAGTAMPAQDEDCYHWNNAANILCYDCNSCKAGVLEQVRKEWHKLSIINVVILLFLVVVYFVAFCAFRNARRDELAAHHYRPGSMSKPSAQWDPFWWRLWGDRRGQVY
ncbi:hypothetical protein J5N97_013703 [Dioscorea zingiberensis]|uniref:Tetraspanin-6 n=1 Tax=Dioscorea zingiberensis TaxID=325984 RepID=A0A9D5HJ13_9LILI|nr:hypothetical protein J5N97_013703 [Dioscorea zingiberensis]